MRLEQYYMLQLSYNLYSDQPLFQIFREPSV